ncbi:MAG TPA: hypothetical protein VNL15_06600 [Dehalococcoidia bacterium]|nr:hypothetical protein [Dehalococcoidia bacterium]
MWDRDAEQEWRAAKESYPQAIVFHQMDGLVIVRGRDTEVLARECRIQTSSGYLGFEEELALAYMSALLAKGYTVVKLAGGRVIPFEKRENRQREIQRQRGRSEFLAVDPALVLERSDIERASGKLVRDLRHQQLVKEFRQHLERGDMRPLKEYGEIYIYPFADWYEVDWELTSMIPNHVLLLAKAALEAGCKLPCRLVQPKSRRALRTVRRRPKVIEQPKRLGQLQFGDLTSEWSR